MFTKIYNIFFFSVEVSEAQAERLAVRFGFRQPCVDDGLDLGLRIPFQVDLLHWKSGMWGQRLMILMSYDNYHIRGGMNVDLAAIFWSSPGWQFWPLWISSSFAIRKPDLFDEANEFGGQNRALNFASTAAEKPLDMLHGWPWNPERMASIILHFADIKSGKSAISLALGCQQWSAQLLLFFPGRHFSQGCRWCKGPDTLEMINLWKETKRK